MSDAPLRGATVLTTGGPAHAADAVRSELAGAGATLLPHAPEISAALLAVTSARPDAVLVIGSETGEALRDRLDPLGVGVAPPIVPAVDRRGEVASRLAAAVERHRLLARVRDLEAVVAAQAVNGRREVDAGGRDALRRLALAADYRDDNTRQHTERVGHLAALLGRRLGLEPRTVAVIRTAAPLHDVGKIAIPDHILVKPDRLDPEEYEVVKSHAMIGARILSGGRSELLEVGERIARSHHERWDGSGYPDGVEGESIPLVGRLVAVADVFDVLVHERPYKEEWSVADAAGEISGAAGTQLDPQVVEAFLALGERAWTSPPG